jgi:uracil-DNA glycosylase family 4
VGAEDEVRAGLAGLQADINACRDCEPFASGFAKPPEMDRGGAANVMIVGQGPGKGELTSGRAFSGFSGNRLNEWLVACGADPSSPRALVYCTSITKCFTSEESALGRMTQNCQRFLRRQFAIVRPRLVITLGTRAFDALSFDGTPACDAWCRIFDSRKVFPLMPEEDQHHLLAWPHPSGMNRWHNDPENKVLLASTFDVVASFLKGET